MGRGGGICDGRLLTFWPSGWPLIRGGRLFNQRWALISVSLFPINKTKKKKHFSNFIPNPYRVIIIIFLLYFFFGGGGDGGGGGGLNRGLVLINLFGQEGGWLFEVGAYRIKIRYFTFLFKTVL